MIILDGVVLFNCAALKPTVIYQAFKTKIPGFCVESIVNCCEYNADHSCYLSLF